MHQLFGMLWKMSIFHVEAVNLTNEALVLRQPEFGNVVHSVDEFGTRYYVGASIKF